MSDCISRQAAIEQFIALWECIDEIMDKEEWEDVCKTTANEIPSAPLYTPDELQTMQDLEWAQMEKMYEIGKAERKKGKWIPTYSDCGGDVWVSWKCSNCGYVRKKGWKYNGGEKPDALFCEMCNADMRGE